MSADLAPTDEYAISVPYRHASDIGSRQFVRRVMCSSQLASLQKTQASGAMGSFNYVSDL
ncbi:hypothetical protein [Aporhodopirellula aestuarii]|uniref:Uncharacterized protein n=1 Tax=Aporhodopirellula aestuarii TaxID=2950107 RepID=A0ABT0U9T8_9BACT|nr:hypothetical protein [Aporhodopirellula aestuarii]MCM2373636.1 hypothetical protein [Aporhodopirellula aestuarii]